MSTRPSESQSVEGGTHPVRTCAVRTCAGCGAKKTQREMLRIASKDGAAPVVDTQFRAAGRGAYLCRKSACMERALQRHSLERTLKLKTSVPVAIRMEIEQALSVMGDG
jgi:predicted RNA-binding protein YlxR (DUF448 family)